MKQNVNTQAKPKSRFETLRAIMAVLFHCAFLLLAILLSAMPQSWFAAEEYEDLGEKTFIAGQVSSRVSRSQRDRRNVVYRAVDGSGLEFKIEYHIFAAERVVENQDTVQRHVYIVIEKPFLSDIFLRKFEMQFVPTDKDLQDHLDTFQKDVTFARRLSLIYSAAYGVYMVAIFLRRRTQKKLPAIPPT